MGTIELRILGTLEVLVDNAPISIQGLRGRTVLAALVLARGDVVSVDRLADAVWGEGAPCTAEKQVRNAVSELRQLCPELRTSIRTTRPGYRLDVPPSCVDAAVFGEAVNRGREQAAAQLFDAALTTFRSAMGLWRGRALEGIDSQRLSARTVGLDEQRLQATEEWIELELMMAPPTPALIGSLFELVEENPYRDQFIAYLMRALVQTGATLRARAVYEKARLMMSEDLGVQPGPVLQDAYRKLMSSNPVAQQEHVQPRRPPVCSVLHPNTSYFVGRRQVLQQLEAALDRPHPGAGALISIDGMAGSGKSSLATHFARSVSSRFPDGQLFIDLATHTGSADLRETHSVLEVLLRAVGISASAMPGTPQERATLWQSAFAQRAMTVVLDDAASTDQVRHLIPPSARSLVIVTSRQWLSRLEPSHAITLDTMTSVEARELFERVVGDDRPTDDPESLEKIVGMCGNLPLAIRIVAARLRHQPSWSLADFVEHLDADHWRIGCLSAENRCVASAFDASFRLLSEDQRRVFRVLGAPFIQQIDPWTVAASADIAPSDAEGLLEQLVDVHMLQQPAPGQFQINELLRLYAVKLYEAAQEAADPLHGLNRTG